jgi:hypothetical protein
MTKYLAGVLTVIAAGVLLVAYGLLNPRMTMDASTAMAPVMRPSVVAEPVSMPMQPAAAYGAPAYGYVPVSTPAGYAAVPVTYTPAPVAYAQPAVINTPAPRQAPQTVSYAPEPARRAAARRIEKPKNDWKRTAMIIGGSSAAGAGVGAIFGGKKGALIGAAIGGGASTIQQVLK